MLLEAFTKHLDDVFNDFTHLITIGGGRLEQVPEDRLYGAGMRAVNAIQRAVGAGSIYYQQAHEALNSGGYVHLNIRKVFAALEALRADIQGGHLQTLEELIHGDVFGDFLDMADYLLSEGYKDAAAVIAGSTLEGHLRNLCGKFSIPTTYPDARPKKANTLNSELVAKHAYTNLDLKNVTAWLDLRNKAAHGHYDEYQTEQVKLMISGIRDFVTRVPA